MKYRIRIDLAFDDEDPCQDILDKALDHLPEAYTFNPGQDNEERGYIIIEECHHDESPNTPCTVIEEHLAPLP